MGFFEDVINTTKSVAESAGKKTDEVVKITKLKTKKSQLKSDLKSKFLKLGEMSYEMKKAENADNEAFEAVVAEIDALYEELHKVEAELDEVKQVITCSACGAKTANENAFCPKCGAKLPEKPEKPVVEDTEESDEEVNHVDTTEESDEDEQ